jgi:hypothetical protein
MGKQKQLKERKPQPIGSASGNAPMANWFTQHISRRAVGKGLAWTAVLGMAGITVVKLAGSGDSETNLDSLDLQKREGWNVGSTDKVLSYGEGWAATDSRGRADIGGDSKYLISIYQPQRSEWQPFFVPTLIQSLSDASLNAQVKMINTPAMRDSYNRADALRNLISQSPNAKQTLIISDLPGPSSVALGAALADTAEIVPAFDNWPHPLGVVHSHETLGALIYYAHEVEEKRSRVGENKPAILLLDSNRLATYTDQDSQFDNRYTAKLPPADQLKQRAISNVIYLVKDESQSQETDDINEDFVEWQKQGINVRLLRLTDFKPYENTVAQKPVGTATAGTATAGTATPVMQTHYYYGGYPWTHWWFYSYYPYSSPVILRDYQNTSIPRPSSRSTYAPPPAPPPYRPTSRPTIFSSARVGGASTTGVGRSRPSGFGRTSVRMSNGSVTGVRSGRSGSYGRSGGGWFGG